MRLWTSAVASEHGVDVLGIFTTEEKAQHAIYLYVSRWWDENDCWLDGSDEREFPTEPPKDEKEAIEIYFENHDSQEHYDVSLLEVDD